MSITILPTEILLKIFTNVSPIDLENISKSHKNFYNICKNNTNRISKFYLKKFRVDYKDPTNFIYIYNEKDVNDYIQDKQYNYTRLFKLYMRAFEMKEIRIFNTEMTSFPVYPNMTHFKGSRNLLTSFEVQPKMIHFIGSNNRLTSFPVQPEMTHFYGSHNQLTSFQIQPEMTHFYGSRNQLTSFQVQPKMTLFYGCNNNLTSFPIQPKMNYFDGTHNQLTNFPI